MNNSDDPGFDAEVAYAETMSKLAEFRKKYPRAPKMQTLMVEISTPEHLQKMMEGCDCRGDDNENQS